MASFGQITRAIAASNLGALPRFSSDALSPTTSTTSVSIDSSIVSADAIFNPPPPVPSGSEGDNIFDPSVPTTQPTTTIPAPKLPGPIQPMPTQEPVQEPGQEIPSGISDAEADRIANAYLTSLLHALAPQGLAGVSLDAGVAEVLLASGDPAGPFRADLQSYLASRGITTTSGVGPGGIAARVTVGRQTEIVKLLQLIAGSGDTAVEAAVRSAGTQCCANFATTSPAYIGSQARIIPSKSTTVATSKGAATQTQTPRGINPLYLLGAGGLLLGFVAWRRRKKKGGR